MKFGSIVPPPSCHTNTTISLPISETSHKQTLKAQMVGYVAYDQVAEDLQECTVTLLTRGT